jgi:ATP-dependent Clp protease ATP-binding subunit ClpA
VFDRFTDRSRNVMALARQQAQRLGHDYIGAEHVLLALPDAGGGGAAALVALGVTRERLRAAVELEATPGETKARSDGQLPFTAEAKAVLEGSLEAAQRAKSRAIQTEHILLGVLGAARATSPAGRALAALRITDLAAAQAAVSNLPSTDAERVGG